MMMPDDRDYQRIMRRWAEHDERIASEANSKRRAKLIAERIELEMQLGNHL